jgi:6,7-dimethyl-8-ribityllumazine synthase
VLGHAAERGVPEKDIEHVLVPGALEVPVRLQADGGKRRLRRA